MSSLLRLYAHIGNDPIDGEEAALPQRLRVQDSRAVAQRIELQEATHAKASGVTCTFIVDAAGDLYLADRHSEHVACARGGPVRAAGEMTFVLESGRLHLDSITNQSTGYCPEPESWSAVAEALARAGFAASELPTGFAPAFTFRRCPACRTINIIKEDIFLCGVCDTGLPAEWNCDR